MLIDLSAWVPDAVPPDIDDQALVELTVDLARNERRVRAAFIVHLAQLDERKLYLQEGCSTLFTTPSVDQPPSRTVDFCARCTTI